MRPATYLALILTTAIASAASCGGQTVLVGTTGTGGGGGSTGAGPLCVPGAQATCGCPGSEPLGVQVCKADGSGYGACACGHGGAPTTGSSSTTGTGGGSSTSSSSGTGVGAPASALAEDLVVHYTFDDGSGLLAHESTGLGTEGVLHGFPADGSQWVAGVIGGALSFRGPTYADYVIAPNYVKPTASMTASAWASATASPTWGMIVQNWGSPYQVGQFHFGLELDSGNLSVHFDGAPSLTTESAGILPIGSWHHVAFVADAAAKTVTLYVDGQPTGQPGAYDGMLLSPPMESLGIGVHTDDTGTMPAATSSGFWQGILDDLGIWTRALTPAEVALVHQAGLAGVGIKDIGTRPSGATCTTGASCASQSCVGNVCN